MPRNPTWEEEERWAVGENGQMTRAGRKIKERHFGTSSVRGGC